MKFITQFLLILAFSFAGELLHWLLPLPVPASIYGIALLFAALLKGWVRVSDVREVSMEEIRAKNNPAFAYCIEDQQRYPAMTAFVLYRAWGEIFDYDFDMKKRDHKLERERFCFGGHRVEEPGLVITESCTGCGRCMKVCTFKAIRREGERYVIDGSRCDECGDCWVHCPAGAVRHKGLPQG